MDSNKLFELFKSKEVWFKIFNIYCHIFHLFNISSPFVYLMNIKGLAIYNFTSNQYVKLQSAYK